MRYDDLRIYGNGKYVPRIHINLSFVNGGQVINFILETNVTVDNLIGNIELWTKKNRESSAYEVQGLKTSINFCRVFEGITSHFLIRTLVEAVKGSGNKMFTCPFAPQVYQLKDLPVVDKFIPKFLLMSSIYFKINVSVKGKFGQSKKFEHFFSQLSFGIIEKD